MLVAFAWWTILLFQKNQDAFKAKSDFMEIVMFAEKKIQNKQDLYLTPEYLDLEKRYTRQEWMILGEAIFFVISIVIGIWLINRGYNRVIETARQSRNFLLSISHELKSPLSSIKLTMETFIKRDLDKEKMNKLATNALSETERLNELVDNLLLASKMETAYEPTYEKFNLVELIDNLVARLAMKYPKSSITFTHELEAVHTVADKFGLTLVIVNLIENAKKYSFGNAEIKVSLDQTEDGLTLQIGDQGIGIADKNKKKVFDRFYRIGDEETRKTKGTGLGLYIVKQVISAANGKIAILDNRPKGTIVDIFLPNKETPKAYITE
jgi:signal transduction histidine kinase